MNQVSIFLEHPLYPFILPFSKNVLGYILEGMRKTLCKHFPAPVSPQIEVFFVTDAKICSLNREYMGKSGPTNILTFPFADNLAGTLALSLDTLQRECVLYGQNLSGHLLFLLAHGFAHISGDDHETPFFQIHAKEYEDAGLKIMKKHMVSNFGRRR